MTTIIIPKNLIMEKDLMVIENDKHLWKSVAKDKFFESYSKSDVIYDQI